MVSQQFSFPNGTARRGTSASLNPLTRFGSNPGNLLALTYVPPDLDPGAPLVVVLHGCTQTAAVYDRGSGWSELAAAHGFALLFVEQQRANNHNLCFNWYEAADQRRDGGEPQSICQMVEAMVGRHGIDQDRVFITGLSAGGAMAAVMLATHPELFAGAAIVAGLPFGAAVGVGQALSAMSAPVAGAERPIARAGGRRGRWPTIAVWHGEADHLVRPGNGVAIVEQWRRLHGAEDLEMVERQGGGLQSTIWRDSSGRAVIEHHRVAGMGHGLPIATDGSERAGIAGPHMLDVGISSTYRIAASWGIVPEIAPELAETTVVSRIRPSLPSTPLTSHGTSRTEQVIRDALRSAGLL